MPFDTAVVSAVKTIWAKARPKRCSRPSDQAPPINDRASDGDDYEIMRVTDHTGTTGRPREKEKES
jgi:hypothetical protein